MLDRRTADEHIWALSRGERRVLKSFGVRFGAFSLYLPALLTEDAQAVGTVFADLAAPGWRPARDSASILPHPVPPQEALGLRGLATVAGLAIPVLTLEKFDALVRAASPDRPGLVEATPALLASVGWKPGQADAILRALGFVRIKTTDPGEASRWSRRPLSPRPPAVESASSAPASAEARGAPLPLPARKGRRRRTRRQISTASGTSA